MTMRVLAVITDASIEVALAALDGDFEIASVRDPDAALAEACHCDVALVALGTTERGLQAVEALHRLRVGIPCLIVGDVPSVQDGAAEDEPAHVLTRPFAMSNLIEALRSAARSRAVAASLPSPEDTAPTDDSPIVQSSADGDADAGRDWALALLHEIGQSSEDGAPSPAPAVRLVPAGSPAQPWQRPEPPAMRRLRRRRRSVAPAPAGQSRAATLRRIRAALEGARDLESLVVEMPALADPETTAAAVVREVVDLLGPETVALYARAGSIWEIVAAHGISQAEQGCAVAADQPLFADVCTRLEAVLVTPVDLVRGLVGGIAGTGVQSLMVAPLEVDGTCQGILVAGRAAFAEEDLERLWLLAEEAAPGFAAARLLQRLRQLDLPLAL